MCISFLFLFSSVIVSKTQYGKIYMWWLNNTKQVEVNKDDVKNDYQSWFDDIESGPRCELLF